MNDSIHLVQNDQNEYFGTFSGAVNYKQEFRSQTD